MSLLQAAVCIVLWRSGRFDTLDIAQAINVSEPDVCRMLDAVRDRERGPSFTIIQGSLA